MKALIRNLWFLVITIMLFAAPSLAGGLYITEYGDPSQGASGAGSGVLAQDSSTAFHNPAGIMLLEPRKNHWMFAAMYVGPSTKFAKEAGTTVQPAGGLPGGNGGDAGVSAVAGALFWARPINESIGFVFSLNSVSAAALKYDSDNAATNANNFVGRYWATVVDLLTINVTPSIAWQFAENRSLGFAVPVKIGSLDLNVAVPTGVTTLPATDGNATVSDGDDVSATVSVSLLWEATERLRFGAAYTGENELNFNGDLSVSGPGGSALPVPPQADVTIPFVQSAKLWASSDVGERLTVLATLGWEDWSSFDNLLIQAGGGGAVLPRNWKDTWKVALGIRWRTQGAWTHYIGAAYDSSPTRESDRTADMPIDKQLRLSAGTNYLFNNGFSLGGVLTYADYGDARINNTESWGTVVGQYSTNRIIFLGLNLGW